MATPDHAGNALKDWVRQPSGWIIWWGLPIAIGISTNFLRFSLIEAASIWAGAFAWMGTGCLLNARRCSRLHCFVSGPVLWLGAVAAALVGAGVIVGPHTLSNVVSITTVLVLLSFVPEMIWGKYAHHG